MDLDANAYLKWTGSALEIKGDLNLSQTIYTYEADLTSAGSLSFTNIQYTGANEETVFGANGLDFDTAATIATTAAPNY